MGEQTLEQVIDRYGIPVDAGDLVDAFAEGLAGVARTGATPLTAGEREFLLEHGGPGIDAAVADTADDATGERAVEVVRAVGELIGSTRSLAETARLLGVDRSRVSHRIAQGSLWAVPVGNTRRAPAWQFTSDGGLLTGLAEVVRAIPDGVDALTVEAFMHAPQPEFDDRTAVEYLSRGGDPALVAGFIGDLARW